MGGFSNLTPVRLAIVLSVCVFRLATKTCPATAPRTKTAMIMLRVVVKLSGSAGLSGAVVDAGVAGVGGGAMAGLVLLVWMRRLMVVAGRLLDARAFTAAGCVEGVLGGDC